LWMPALAGLITGRFWLAPAAQSGRVAGRAWGYHRSGWLIWLPALRAVDDAGYRGGGGAVRCLTAS
jgi:hypothetical protein